MKVWELTPAGTRLARTAGNPDTDRWRIVHYLDFVGRATTEQVVEGARAPSAAGDLAILSRTDPPIVKEFGGASNY